MDIAYYDASCLVYAEDVAVIVRGEFGQTISGFMNDAFKLTAMWCDKWVLSVNPHKTSLVAFSRKNSTGSGQWLSSLLPLCLLHLTAKSHSALDRLNFLIATWLCVSQFVKQVIYARKNPAFHEHYLFLTILSIPASFIISWFIPFDIVSLYLLSLATVLSYNYLISKLLINCHGSFSLGEVQVIAQGIVVFVFYSLISFKKNENYSYEIQYFEAVDLLKLLLLGLFLLVCILHFVPVLRQGVQFHFICCNVAAAMLLIWSFCHQKNVIPWFWEFCTYSDRRVYLLLFWMISTFASVAFVLWINKKSGYTVSTLDRKYFHIIINAVYIPGVIYDIQFLCFASGIALGAFIVLEIYRILRIPVIGPSISDAFHIFLDEKDSGLLILTHIYLLIGCSSPIWLSSHYVHNNEYHISLFSGIISVGFGDTFAAIGGTFFGKNFWKGSKKTLEGTACAVIAQLAASMYFMNIGHHFSVFNISLVIVSILLTSLLEAKTNEVDNLVLPLFMLSFLSWIH